MSEDLLRVAAEKMVIAITKKLLDGDPQWMTEGLREAYENLTSARWKLLLINN